MFVREGDGKRQNGDRQRLRATLQSRLNTNSVVLSREHFALFIVSRVYFAFRWSIFDAEFGKMTEWRRSVPPCSPREVVVESGATVCAALSKSNDVCLGSVSKKIVRRIFCCHFNKGLHKRQIPRFLTSALNMKFPFYNYTEYGGWRVYTFLFYFLLGYTRSVYQ